MADLTSTPGSKMTRALLAVIVERERQVLTEGWDAAHDDEHDDGSLALAAACYAAPMATKGKSETVDVSGGRGEGPVWGRKRFVVPFLWPDSWDASWWKPKDRRSDLVRAAALLLAEIERLDRAAEQPKWSPCARCTTPDYCTNQLRGCDISEALEAGIAPFAAGVAASEAPSFDAEMRKLWPDWEYVASRDREFARKVWFACVAAHGVPACDGGQS